MKKSKEKICFSIKGTVNKIHELIHIEREGIPDLEKRILTIETPDGQILYPELRNAKLPLLERENIQEGDAVEIEILFQGSHKNGKNYNNIYIYSIKGI